MPVVDEAAGVVASPERIAAWLVCAKPGDEFVYATRCGLPVASPGAKAAREAQAQGLVALIQRRLPDRRAFNYVARRTARSLPVEASPGRGKPANDGPHVANEVRAMNAVLDLLRRAAKFARPCPTDFAMARRADITRRDVEHVMAELERANVIRIQRAPAPTLRQVTIVGTGHRTGLVR